MLRDPVSNPIRWLMLVSAIVLVVFLYNFTNKTLAYIDYTDQQSQITDQKTAKAIKKHREMLKIRTMENIQSIDEP